MAKAPSAAAPKGPSGPRLDLRQTQSLTMTPALQQAIALLQMSNQELEEVIAREVEANPFLERADDGQAQVQAESHNAVLDNFNHTSNYTAPGDLQNLPGGRNERLEFDTDNLYNTAEEAGPAARAEAGQDSQYWDEGSVGGSFDYNDMPSFEARIATEDSLFHHLRHQIMLEFAAPQDRLIAFALMEGLDEAGYFRGSLTSLAEQFACDISDIDMVLSRLQHCDPCGIFALNLAQCMEIQLREKGLLTAKVQTFLSHLSLLEKHDFEGIKKRCHLNEDELKGMLVLLRRLDPKPGTKFTHDVVQTRVADILMHRNSDPNNPDSWRIELNPDSLPRVLINQRYVALINDRGVKKGEKQFMTNQYQGAQWLVKAMDQRAQTILKVSAEIVRQQEAFFAYGVSYLKPLVLRDIAKEVEVHESTVSRVTTGKYMQTPRGLFELKYFFSSSVGDTRPGANTMVHAAQAIKARIQELINAEDKQNVLSDDELVMLLGEEGIPVARRTVAKYREALGIGSSTIRRRQKRLG